VLRKLLILLIFFGSIPASAESILCDGEITNVTSTIYFYENLEALWRAKPEYDGQIEALSSCYRNKEKNMAYCDIYVIRALTVDNAAVLALGHEVYHGICGVNYHKGA